MAILLTKGAAGHNAGYDVADPVAFTDVSIAIWGYLVTLPSVSAIISKIAYKGLTATPFTTDFIFQVLTSNLLFFRPFTGAATNDVTGATALSGATWMHLGATFSDANDRSRVYLDGVQDGVNAAATGAMSDTAGKVSVGYRDPFDAEVFDGRLAEFGLWNVELTADEMAMLAAGVPPMFVRPDGLIVHLPLWGDVATAPDHSPVGTNDGTRVETGTATVSDADHPSQVGWAMGDTAYSVLVASPLRPPLTMMPRYAPMRAAVH